MSRQALLIITTSYPQLGDGSEAAGSFVKDIVDELSQIIDVRVVAPGIPKAGEHPDPARIWRYSAGARPLSLLSARNPLHWPAIARVLISMRRQALAASSDGNISHVLAFWVLPSGWAGRIVAKKWGIGYSVWALGSDIWMLGKLPAVNYLLKRVARDASHAFSDGLQLARDAQRLTGRAFSFLASTRSINGHGLRANHQGPPYRLVFLGRWHPNKGIDLLMEALTQLGDAVWSRIERVRIHGGGEMASIVRDRAQALTQQGRPVEVTGYLDKAQAICSLQDADWLVIPSRVESIPLVFSDAMKLGLPVITTPVGDLAELVEEGHGCGIVADEISSVALARALARALEGTPMTYLNGVERMAARFDLRHVVAQVLQLASVEMERPAHHGDRV